MTVIKEKEKEELARWIEFEAARVIGEEITLLRVELMRQYDAVNGSWTIVFRFKVKADNLIDEIYVSHRYEDGSKFHGLEQNKFYDVREIEGRK